MTASGCASFNRCFFNENYNSKLARPGDDKRFYSQDASVMSRWHDDERIIAVQLMVIYFSREKQVSVAPTDVYLLPPPLPPCAGGQ